MTFEYRSWSSQKPYQPSVYLLADNVSWAYWKNYEFISIIFFVNNYFV